MLTKLLNKTHCMDNCDGMMMLPRKCIDLVVTSPPYDDLRTYGGHSWGISFPLWPTALEVVSVALPGAILGLIAAPLIAAGAAWFPARHVLRQDTLDMLTPEHLG